MVKSAALIDLPEATLIVALPLSRSSSITPFALVSLAINVKSPELDIYHLK